MFASKASVTWCYPGLKTIFGSQSRALSTCIPIFTRANLDESPNNGLSGRSVPSNLTTKARQAARTNEEKWHANQVSSIKLR